MDKWIGLLEVEEPPETIQDGARAEGVSLVVSVHVYMIEVV